MDEIVHMKCLCLMLFSELDIAKLNDCVTLIKYVETCIESHQSIKTNCLIFAQKAFENIANERRMNVTVRFTRLVAKNRKKYQANGKRDGTVNNKRLAMPHTTAHL